MLQFEQVDHEMSCVKDCHSALEVVKVEFLIVAGNFQDKCPELCSRDPQSRFTSVMGEDNHGDVDKLVFSVAVCVKLPVSELQKA